MKKLYYDTTRTCKDCGLFVQGGDWGWVSHRFWLHGEGTAPASSPYDDGTCSPQAGRRPRTDAEKAESRRRRAQESIKRGIR